MHNGYFAPPTHHSSSFSRAPVGCLNSNLPIRCSLETLYASIQPHGHAAQQRRTRLLGKPQTSSISFFFAATARDKQPKSCSSSQSARGGSCATPRYKLADSVLFIRLSITSRAWNRKSNSTGHRKVTNYELEAHRTSSLHQRSQEEWKPQLTNQLQSADWLLSKTFRCLWQIRPYSTTEIAINRNLSVSSFETDVCTAQPYVIHSDLAFPLRHQFVTSSWTSRITSCDTNIWPRKRPLTALSAIEHVLFKYQQLLLVFKIQGALSG